MARTAREPLSPCDLAGAKAGRVRVAGRVARVGGAELELADALSVVRVRGVAPFELAPGDLVVLEGRLARGTVTAARVVERAAHPTPR